MSLTPNASYANNVNAGTATASYSYAGDDNHEASSNSKDFNIAKATATITVTPYSVNYDGLPHTATGSAIGVDAGGAALGTSFNLSGTSHSGVGNYSGDRDGVCPDEWPTACE